MRISLFFLLIYHLLFMGSLHAQHTLKGKVLDAASLEPVPFTNLFIASSTIGTVTNVNGLFELTVPSGNYDLVIQHLGYQSLRFSFSTQGMLEFYEFRMSAEPMDLEETKVSGKRDKSWYDNLELFKKYFLGESINAKQCKILNPEILVLDMETNPGVLRAYANELLEIENPNLGYDIKYLLTGFEYDMEREIVSYSGFPYFIEQDLPRRRIKRTNRNREMAFKGSVAHLIKALYSGSADEEGFLFYEVVKIPDPQNMNSLIEKPLEDPIFSDSITGATPGGKQQFILYDKPLFIVYKYGFEEPNYHNYSLRHLNPYLRKIGLDNSSNPNYPTELPQVSRMEMKGKAVQIFHNGSFFHPMDMFFQGYMAWEKVGDLMPLDYE